MKEIVLEIGVVNTILNFDVLGKRPFRPIYLE